MKLLMKCCTAALLLVGALANQQAWSERSYMDKAYTLNCNFTSGNLSVSADHQLSWSKLGRETDLETDDLYQLLNHSGVTNMLLRIKRVTPETGGIYFCTVRDSSGESVGRVVKGLNIAGHLTEDKFEEYRWDVIRGAISAACVFGLVVSICLIDRFRYKTDEQKQKTRERKMKRLQQSSNGGVDNLAMQDDSEDLGKHNGSLASAVDGNTHL